MQVMHVPKHTAGSIALARDDGVVFSGEALLRDKDGKVIPPDPRLALDPARASASAETITARHAALLLTGHGSPARPSEERADKERARGSSEVAESPDSHVDSHGGAT